MIPINSFQVVFLRWKWIALIVCIHLCLLSERIVHSFPNIDEIGHLAAGFTQWKTLRFDLYRVTPPLVHYVAGFPAWFFNSNYDLTLFTDRIGERPEFLIGVEHLIARRISIISSFVLPRLFCVIFSVVGCVTLTYYVFKGFGFISAHIVCAFWCFCPSILAFAPTVIPDVAAVTSGMIASLSVFSYQRKSTCLAACICGALAGLAMLSKLTWITLAGSVPLAILVCRYFDKFRSQERTIPLRLLDLTVFLIAACFLLNSGYLFEHSFTPLREFHFCSETLGGSGTNPLNLGNRFAEYPFSSLPVPLPKNYFLGIDYLRHEVESKYWSFLDGEWKLGSWEHYYVLTTVFKTPEPTLFASVLGLVIVITSIKKGVVNLKDLSLFVLLIIPAAVCFASISLQGGFNHHHRYVLMIYPPMFALAAYIASPVGVKLLRFRLPFLGRKKRSIAIPLAITLVTLSAVSALRVHPYYTSYFNTLSGGPQNGWRRLGFSNIDWGQDILEVDQWLKKYPERRPLVMDIDYFGMNGDLFDVPTSSPPLLPLGASVDEVRRSITETQWWIISVKKLYNLPDQPGLQYLQQIEPVERIAYAYHVYRIDPLPSEESSSPDKPTP
jgi:hypothetical protein